MKILILTLILFFSSSLTAEDISDFEIEGISIGDSLLEYMTESEIKSEIKWSKDHYYYKTEEFAEVYRFKKGIQYEYLSFLIKPNDKEFLIYGIYGNIDNNIDECLKIKKNIVKEFDLILLEANKIESKFNPSFDKTGRSVIYYTDFEFNSDDEIKIECYNYSESYAEKRNVTDGLSISLHSYETIPWLQQELK